MTDRQDEVRTATAEELRSEFEKTVRRYQRVGVLIDDAIEAPGRVARALYGTEQLPYWWLVARSVECGVALLEQVEEALRRQRLEGGKLGCIVIADRHLPADCSARTGLPFDWDAQEVRERGFQRICDSMSALIRRMIGWRDSGTHRNFYIELETRYPYSSWQHDKRNLREPLPWRTRNVNLLYRLRQNILENADQTDVDLLVFGPADGDHSPAVRNAIAGVATALTLEHHKVVVLKGFGAPRRASERSRGMPPLGHLIQQACTPLLSKDLPGESGDREDAIPCVCTSSKRDAGTMFLHREFWDPKTGVTPVRWLVDQLDRGKAIEELDLRFEHLFSSRKNDIAQEQADFHKFCDAFFVAHQRYDMGFPYCYWLLSQLPCTLVINTNFDSFFERAVAHSASSKGRNQDRGRILTLASRLPEDFEEGDFGEHRYAKPFGSILLPGSPGLADKEFQHCTEVLRTALGMLGPRDWFVVLGHSMQHDYVDRALQKLDEAGKHRSMNLLWVDREAATQTRDGDQDRIWIQWMRDAVEQKRYGPLALKPHEFIYDLWQSYRGVRS